jgi:alpha-tubulin suppressor-like RCC1 family protein
MSHDRRTAAKLGRLSVALAACVIALMTVVGATASAANQAPRTASGVSMAAPIGASAPPIAVGGNHACALPGDGTVRCWGNNTSGQLGDGNTTGPSVLAPGVVPPLVTVIAAAGSTAPLSGVVAMTAGLAHTCALLADTTVRCWGSNAGGPDLTNPMATTTSPGGQLGDGTSTNSAVPVTVIASAISPGALTGVTAIAAGGDSTCARLADGTMKCWGGGSLAPITIRAAASSSSPLSGVAAIAVGDTLTCALLVDGTVTCWGASDMTPTTILTAPGSSSPLSGVVAITSEHGDDSFLTGTGHLHSAGSTCALLVDRTVRCWGSNDGGQLGDGTTTDSQTPVAVVSSSGGGVLTGVSAIASGAAHTCALLAAGTVQCWGLSSVDTLDAGLHVPTMVTDASGTSPLANVSAIAAGGHQTCALLADGSVECWGAVVEPPQLIPGLLIASPAAAPAPTPTPPPTSTPAPTPAPVPPSPPSGSIPPAGGPVNASLPGDWSVTYGSPSVVTISYANGSYTVIAKSPVEVTGGPCFLPPGTLIATFSGSGPTFTGQHGLWYTPTCSFARWTPLTVILAGTALTVVLGNGERHVLTRIGNPQLPFRDSVPTPAQITFDPIIVAQSVAIAAGIVILVPFPAILFNRTLEENYPEIVRRVRRARRRLGVRRRLGAMLALLAFWVGRRLRGPTAHPASTPQPPGPESAPDSVRTDPELEQNPGGGFWRTPLGMVLFVLLSALLYGFLDPTFGLDSQSLAAFAGLAVGLVVTLLAFCVPLALAYARSTIPFSVQALPGTLAVGLACVLLTRVTDFHPGYLYGLVVTFVVARELSVAVEGRAMALATGTTLVVAVVAWFGLLWVGPLTPAHGDPGLALIALQTALVMALVAGVELTVFGMLPLRFLPGENVYRWKRRVWAALFGIGMFGFVHILMNPRSGYLADTTRTPMVTIVVLLLFFALFSVAFWAYFRFRRVPAAPSVT